MARIKDKTRSVAAFAKSCFSKISMSSFMFSKGSDESANRVPTPDIKATFDRVNIQAALFYPITKALSFISNRYETIASCISQLFCSSSPSAVFLRVVSIIINTINLRIFRAKLSNMFEVACIHIMPKLIKRFPFASYTTTTIPPVVIRFRTVTAFKHAIIDILETRATQAMSSRSDSLKPSLSNMPAATTFDVSAQNSATSSNKSIAATAAKLKEPMASFIDSQEPHERKLIYGFPDLILFHT